MSFPDRYRRFRDDFDTPVDDDREQQDDLELRGAYDPEVDWEVEGHHSSSVEEWW